MSRVVIAGGGVGGLAVADRLRQALPDRDEIVVVDRADRRVLGLSLLWVLRGWRDPGDVTFAPSALGARGIEAVAADVERFAPGERRVVTGSGDLSYDALVVALGARLEPERLPGLSDAIDAGVAGEFYTLSGAQALHDRLAEVDGGRVVVLVSRIPFKCPAAPYEAALLIDDLFAERGVRDDVKLDIVTPEPHPMPVAGPDVGRALTEMVQERRIGLHPGVEVESVDAAARELVHAGGERTPFDLLVAVPPHAAPGPVAELGLSDAGWAPVDARTLRTAADGVWAVGDAASLTLANGKPLPKAAVFAMNEAEAVAAGVARDLGHDAGDPWFSGRGHCFIETGSGQAAKGMGSFLEDSGPVVELYGPSAEQHAEKEAEERDWIERWTGRVGEPATGG